jgi:type I restriction enzyme S subunit
MSSDIQIKQTQFFEALHNLLWNDAGLDPAKALEAMTFFFALKMIEPQVDKLKLPEQSKWSYIVNLKDDELICSCIKNEAVAALRKHKDTSPYFRPPDIKKSEIFGRIVKLIDRFFSENALEIVKTDTLGNLFEYMLGRGMSTMADDGQYYTPRYLCKLAFNLAYSVKKTLRRSDGELCHFGEWFCGTGGFLLEYVKGCEEIIDVNWDIDKESIYALDKNISNISTSLLNLLINTGVPFNSSKIRDGDSFRDNITRGNNAKFPDLQLDYSFMNPPYGGDKTLSKEYKFKYMTTCEEGGKKNKVYNINKDIQQINIQDDDKVSAGVQLQMATLGEGGVGVLILPQGFFFGSSKKAIELRKKLIEEYSINYVVDIGSGEFINTSTKTSMLVYQKGVGRTKFVKFCKPIERICKDGSKFYGKELLLEKVSYKQIKEKNYSLNYKIYIPQEIENNENWPLVKLGDICEIRYGKRITKTKDEGTLFPAYGGGELMSYKVNEYNRDGIIYKISRDGMSLNNCVMKIFGKCFINDTALTLETNKNIANEIYLGEWLLINKQNIFNNCSRGTAQLHIDIDTLLSMKIPLPPIEKQQEIVESITYWDQLAKKEEESIELLEKAIMAEVKLLGRGAPRVKLGDVCEFKSGKAIKADDRVNGVYPYYGANGIIDYINTFTFVGEYILTGQDGTIGTFYITNNNIKFNASNHAHIFKSNDLTISLTIYIYYYMKSVNNIKNIVTGTTRDKITLDSIKSYEIPLPPIETQLTLKPVFDEVTHKKENLELFKTRRDNAINLHFKSQSITN